MVKIFPIGQKPINSVVNKIKAKPSVGNIGKQVVLPALTTLAFLAGNAMLTNCTKTLDTDRAQYNKSYSKIEQDFDSILNTLGIIKTNTTVKVIDNICFKDSEGATHILENIQSNEENISFKYSKIKGNIIETSSEIILNHDNGFINLGAATKSGDNIEKKYAISDQKVIEYTYENDILTPSSDFSKTENGFKQNFINGNSKEFKNIKINTTLPAIRISVDTTYNVIEHYITL